MATIFTKILQGEIPGRFVWKDERCFSILTINPIRPGHVMVIPREEFDHWLDLPPDLAHHLNDVATTIGKAQMQAFRPTKVGLAIIGLEVRHVHLHLVPIDSIGDLDFTSADKNPKPEALDAAAAKLRSALRALGCRQVAD